MSTPYVPWDPGLQPERTALAWRRSVLACTVGALGLGRLAVHHSVALCGWTLAVAACLLLVLARLQRVHTDRTEHRLRAGSPLRAGLLPLATTVLTCLLGVCALGYVYVARG
ncbi:DUF202 domain-containing protein [Streptomyces sp. NPDC004111]|uniref:DUF202 domain-containing protein n=1 Tax=Streptomyces sp. NPDC004111 TaxID=3364690 RepID=UPI0036CD3BD7